MTNNPYTKTWNEAYDAYCYGNELDMWDILDAHIESGDITEADAEMMAQDVIEAYHL